MLPPQLLTFDIFGTVLDWRNGLRQDLARHGVRLTDQDFDRVIRFQGEEEQRSFRPYREIVARSLSGLLGMSAGPAAEIGEGAGRWPLFSDSTTALKSLMRHVACAAMTNSDRVHRPQVEEQLGFPLTDWVCAEDSGCYKPAPEFWRYTARRRKIEPGPHWWHVAAYADYDLKTAAELGLTTILIRRPHCVPGPATRTFADLAALATFVSQERARSL